jgi:hypothetical protein
LEESEMSIFINPALHLLKFRFYYPNFRRHRLLTKKLKSVQKEIEKISEEIFATRAFVVIFGIGQGSGNFGPRVGYREALERKKLLLGVLEEKRKKIEKELSI